MAPGDLAGAQTHSASLFSPCTGTSYLPLLQGLVLVLGKRLHILQNPKPLSCMQPFRQCLETPASTRTSAKPVQGALPEEPGDEVLGIGWKGLLPLWPHDLI